MRLPWLERGGAANSSYLTASYASTYRDLQSNTSLGSRNNNTVYSGTTVTNIVAIGGLKVESSAPSGNYNSAATASVWSAL